MKNVFDGILEGMRSLGCYCLQHVCGGSVFQDGLRDPSFVRFTCQVAFYNTPASVCTFTLTHGVSFLYVLGGNLVVVLVETAATVGTLAFFRKL